MYMLFKIDVELYIVQNRDKINICQKLVMRGYFTITIVKYISSDNIRV